MKFLFLFIIFLASFNSFCQDLTIEKITISSNNLIQSDSESKSLIISDQKTVSKAYQVLEIETLQLKRKKNIKITKTPISLKADKKNKRNQIIGLLKTDSIVLTKKKTSSNIKPKIRKSN